MRKIYIENIIEGLKNLASYDYQTIAWFDNNLGLASSLEDDAESVFFDSGLDEAISAKEIVFGREADKMLKELMVVCDGVEAGRGGLEFLNSAEMAKIRQLAKKCLFFIQQKDRQESTVEFAQNNLPKIQISFADRDNL